MWVAGVFAGYLLLALAIPASWALAPVWRRARILREVQCPQLGGPALLQLNGWHAVRMHAIGDQGLAIRHCSRWRDAAECRGECLIQIAAV